LAVAPEIDFQDRLGPDAGCCGKECQAEPQALARPAGLIFHLPKMLLVAPFQVARVWTAAGVCKRNDFMAVWIVFPGLAVV